MSALDTRTGRRASPSSPEPGRSGARLSSAQRAGQDDGERIRQLRAKKRQATGLLVAMFAVFIVVSVVGSNHGALAYVRAAVEGSLVGGLADWFAVVAIFRHPLGLPIPHTAVIVERKDQFGAALGGFVQENFLSSDTITDRIRSSQQLTKAADWLVVRPNAETVAGHAATLVVGLADAVRNEDVHRLIEDEISSGLERVPLAPLAARALRAVTANQRHQELLDSVLRGFERFLNENRDSLRARYARESPWWLPRVVDERIFDRILDGVHDLLREINTDPAHEIRSQVDKWVAALADNLEHAPEYRERGEQLKRDLLGHPELRKWTASLWEEVKATLRSQAANPESELRRRLADALIGAARRLRDDPALTDKVEELVESGIRYVAEHFHDEIIDLVSGTISRWDAAETSSKLEILLGRDLQFIRINGTVVGGLAGLVIFSVGQAIG
ncbi:MAG TPA: DUF445 domain-containing protein [Acidimicrobiales bacterium]|jgi:uncharacterized membrane-anchored protein YjiN (DUF445 family)